MQQSTLQSNLPSKRSTILTMFFALFIVQFPSLFLICIYKCIANVQNKFNFWPSVSLLLFLVFQSRMTVTAFNGDISKWDVGAVTGMDQSTLQSDLPSKRSILFLEASFYLILLYWFYFKNTFSLLLTPFIIGLLCSCSTVFHNTHTHFVEKDQRSIHWTLYFKQGIWCSSAWQKSPFATAFPFSGNSGNAVICCSPGNYIGRGQTAWTAIVADRATQEDCTGCSKGSYTAELNLQTSCTTCPRDEIAPTAGLTGCAPCTAPTFSNDGIKCKICGAGKFTSIGISETHCEPCEAGLYQELSGNSTCLHCPAGWNQDKKGKPFCFPCVPGTSKFVLLWLSLRMFVLLFIECTVHVPVNVRTGTCTYVSSNNFNKIQPSFQSCKVNINIKRVMLPVMIVL